MKRRKMPMRMGLGLVLILALLFAEAGGVLAGEMQNPNPDKLLAGESEEPAADGVRVAEAIQVIVEASGQMELADAEGLERLQDLIGETQTAIEGLTEEETDALSDSIGLLEHATVSVDAMQDAVTQIEESGTLTIEQTGLPNSWRFIDGEPLDEAMVTIREEAKAVTEVVEEIAQAAAEEAAAQEERVPAEDAQEKSAPAETAPNETAQEKTMPVEMTPAETAQKKTTPAEMTPEEAAPEEPAAETAPEETAQEEPAAETTPEETAQGIPMPTEGASEKAASEEPAPETAPAEDALSEMLPESAAGNSGIALNASGEATAEFASLTFLPHSRDGILTAYTPSGKKRKGIDVSQWQGTIDWNKVKAAGIEFAILRCGYGNNEKSQDDSKWARNVSECERLGIPYGVYLYSYATTDAMVDSEVAHTLRLLKGHSPALPVYYDLEENAQQVLGAEKISAMAARYCKKIKAAGYQAGVYANMNWWNKYLDAFEADNNYYHWIAQWPNTMTETSTCQYTKRYELWQYTSSGSVSGINGRVDMNYWYGNFPYGTAPQIVTPTPDPTPTPTPAPAPDTGTWKKEQVGGKTVYRYYEKNGNMVTGQKKIGYYWYMFDLKTGARITDQIYHHTTATNPKGGEKWVYYDANGRMIYGQRKVGGYWYFFRHGSGAMVRDAFYNLTKTDNPRDGAKTCYYDGNGRMVYNQRKIGGYWYMFRPGSGAMVTGFYTHTKDTNPNGGPKTCYYDSRGRLLYGQRKIEGYWYMFRPGSGAMVTGFYKHTKETNPNGGPKTCYYDSKGRMLYGRQKINGRWYTFHTGSGALQ